MPTGARKGEPQEANGGPSLCMDTLFSKRGVGLSQGRIFGTQSFVYVCVFVGGGVLTGPAASEAISGGSLEAPGTISRLRSPALRVSVCSCLWPRWERKGEMGLGGVERWEGWDRVGGWLMGWDCAKGLQRGGVSCVAWSRRMTEPLPCF